MANKRKLKKNISYICSELFSECIATSLYHNGENKDNIDAILNSILIIHNNYICQVSHTEPGMQPKKYYKNLKEQFNIQIYEIIDNIGNI